MLKSLIFLSCSLLLTACASTNNKPLSPDMSCHEIMAEIHDLSARVDARNNSSEVNRTIDTGSTVAAQGASIAGVPYVGSVLSIGKTLLNHNKQTAAIKAQQAEERLYRLQDLAYEKGCLDG